jgi:hypothetical protein
MKAADRRAGEWRSTADASNAASTPVERTNVGSTAAETTVVA